MSRWRRFWRIRLLVAAGSLLLLQGLPQAQSHRTFYHAEILQTLGQHTGPNASSIQHARGDSFADKVRAVIRQIPKNKKAAALGDLKKLEERIRSEARGGQPETAALSALGTAYLELGDSKTAKQTAAEAVTKDDADPRAHRLAALVLAQEGDKDAALEEARRALTLSRTPSEKALNRSLLKTLSTGRARAGHAAAAAHPPAGADLSRDPSLNDKQIQVIDDALVIVWNTPHGKKAIVAVAPQAKNVLNMKDLRRTLYEGGVKIKGDPHGMVKGHAAVREASETDQAEGGPEITHVILLTPETLKNRKEILAPLLGENLDKVDFWRTFGDKLDKALMDLRGRMTGMYIAIEQKTRGIRASVSTSLSQAYNYTLKIWEDDAVKAEEIISTKNANTIYGKGNLELAETTERISKMHKLQGTELIQYILDGENASKGLRHSQRNTDLKLRKQIYSELDRESQLVKIEHLKK